ncbi:MAG: PASTA domain-containing protein [Sphingobacteriales bacterium]|nr:MAG: PASTA domain-containing protein [Sphingobacteriales bacterium]TAF80800.1 MAG: PASTA domain-containing protein [Sphingobacteriales bacterium]
MAKILNYLISPEFRKQLLIAVALIATLIIVLVVSLRFYTRHGEGKAVPNLKGLNIANAIEILDAEGFSYQLDSVFILDKKPGIVVEQDPDPNTQVKINRIIYLTIVSSLTPDVSFPDIDDKTFREAIAILENYGLKLGDTIYKNDIARDAVLAYSYAGGVVKIGQKIPKGTKINLVLGDGMGAEAVEIPSLLGLTLSEAMFSLKGASLNLGMVTYEGMVKDSASAIIVAQKPSPSDTSSKVTMGTKINLILSNK